VIPTQLHLSFGIESSAFIHNQRLGQLHCRIY